MTDDTVGIMSLDEFRALDPAKFETDLQPAEKFGGLGYHAEVTTWGGLVSVSVGLFPVLGNKDGLWGVVLVHPGVDGPLFHTGRFDTAGEARDAACAWIDRALAGVLRTMESTLS